jgi:hypothetical protein
LQLLVGAVVGWWAFNSFPVAALSQLPQTAKLKATRPPNANFQFFPSCSKTEIGGTEVGAGRVSFQFFPSCSKTVERLLRVLAEKDFQFFPSCSECVAAIKSGAFKPFNSFPVAALALGTPLASLSP